MNIPLKHNGAKFRPINCLTIEQAAIMLQTPVKVLKEIVRIIKSGKREAWQREMENERKQLVATYRIDKSNHIPGGLAIFVKTDGAALLQGVSILVEFEIQILGTSSRWSFNPEKIS